jgi:HlyD family secretion protein
MTRKKVFIILAVVLVGGAVAAANIFYKRETGLTVTAEAIRARDLEAIVSASGKIQPKRQVNISANQPGRVTRVAVEEGQRVKAGQFLLELDPRSLEGSLRRGEASIAQARSGLASARVAVDSAKSRLELARQNLQRESQLSKDGLTTRQALEQAQNEVTLAEQELKRAEQDIKTREEQIRGEEAGLETTKYNLTQIIISSPMDGLVTRRNIEEGETAVVGTMNNAGSQLLTIADMSVLEAEVEVDETDIPAVSLGQEAAVTIDAVPDRTFRGRVTEIGNSPIQATAQGGQRQATNFKVVITLEEEVPDVRPGFTCTAEITTATRKEVASVPIQALTVREMLFDPKGNMVREESPRNRRNSSSGSNPVSSTVSASTEPPPGHTREETEGVFVVRDGRAVFTRIKVGVAGERYFEVLEGLKAGDQVITGPFAQVRELADGAEVKIEEESASERRRRQQAESDDSE